MNRLGTLKGLSHDCDVLSDRTEESKEPMTREIGC